MGAVALLLPFAPAVVAAILAVLGWRPVTAWLAPVSCAAVVAGGVALAVRVLDDGPVVARGGLVRVDALSALLIVLVGTVGTITASYGVSYLRTELARGATTDRQARLYGALVPLTVTAMLVVLVADNLGVVWVAVETSTIATVLLVGHRRDRASLEASWKYLVLGSIGMATALLGTVLVYFVSRRAGGVGAAALDWSSLVERAPLLDTGALRVATGLVVLGYGTKAGLAPVHSWLPDAYSQAPAPIAALMAGAVSSMSMYALLRFKAVADVALGAEFVRGLLIAAALLSLVVAASMMITQRDYKRLLAYSSVEHMGLVALAAAIGSRLAVAGALLHLIGNGLVKSVAFSSTGEMLFLTATTRIDGVRGLLHRAPFLGGVFGLSLVGLLGLPPFSLLASEVAIIRAGISEGLAWAIGIAVVVMLAIFTAVLVHALNMLAGVEDPPPTRSHVTPVAARAPLVVGLAVAAAIGVTIWPLERLLYAAADVLAR